MEIFILACLDKKLYGEIPISRLAQGCSVCKEAYVEKVIAHLPNTLKHQCHEHELAICNCAKVYASGVRLNFHCHGCGGRGKYVHYYCTDDSCTLLLHAKCALNFPLSIAAPFHNWHPPLVLTSHPLDPSCATAISARREDIRRIGSTLAKSASTMFTSNVQILNFISHLT